MRPRLCIAIMQTKLIFYMRPWLLFFGVQTAWFNWFIHACQCELLQRVQHL
jgi:hypothetical protein